MKVHSVEIVGLNDNPDKIVLNFHKDLNILTGRNGAGKTNILKLIWYALSGQITQALNEINFKSIQIQTDNYTCRINKLNHNTCQILWIDEKGTTEIFEDVEIEDDEHGFVGIRSAEEIPNRKLRQLGSSVFFPTFRRIEGGFSTELKSELRRRLSALPLTASLEEALSNLSDTLSNNKHIFVASLGTKDIESLLIRKHSELSEKYNDIQKEVSNEAIEKIKVARKTQESQSSIPADELLEQIQAKIESMEISRKEIMKPLDIFKDSVLNFLKYHSGIKIGGRNSGLSFGDAANAINSNSLSAGEKQILSFLAYNTFYKDAVFIIDEPELSLHVDWQRTLFSTLMRQETSNQFIVATHSPFIYSKYPDKEIQLIEDRGYCSINQEAENE